MSYPAYDTYKDSGVEWLGDVPSGWDVIKFNNIYNSRMGATILNSDLDEEGSIPVMSATESSKVFGYVNEAAVILKAGDIIIPARGNSIGHVKLVVNPCTSTQTTILCSNLGKSLPSYIKYYLEGLREVLFYFDQTAIPQITVELVSSNPILLPPEKTQLAIAAFLDEKTAGIDALITKKENLLERLAEKRAALITQTVTKGFDPTVPMKPSSIDWLGDVPEAWRITPLRYLGRLQNGISFSSEKYGYGSPFVSYGDVYKNFELPKNVKGQLKTSKKEQSAYSVIQGDVFFTRTSETIEEIAISSVCMSSIIDATFAGFLIRFRPHKDKLHPNFSKFYFRNQDTRKYFVKEMNLVTRASLNQDLLGGLSVLLPPYSEQQEIGEFLNVQCSKIDKVIKATNESIDKYKEYRTALITNAVTGKIKVV